MMSFDSQQWKKPPKNAFAGPVGLEIARGHRTLVGGDSEKSLSARGARAPTLSATPSSMPNPLYFPRAGWVYNGMSFTVPAKPER
jgi:hypothetical protein